MGYTTEQYENLDEAYKYFNDKLFEGKLPDCIITFQRKKGMNGYFHFERFSPREGKGIASELALNPDNFNDRDDVEILSTIVHEQTHVWQQYFADAPKRNYHDKEWGRKMKEIGLYPSATGEPGGKETGARMTHYVIPGGPFEIACGAFLLKGRKIKWNSIVIEKEEKERKKTRVKYVCESCHVNVWGKPNLNVACGDCLIKMVVEEE